MQERVRASAYKASMKERGREGERKRGESVRERERERGREGAR